MPQIQLPIFPADCVDITPELAFKNENGIITYFNGSMPVFSHAAQDIKSFRMITSQFYVNGNATQSEISKAFGVSLISVKRAVKCYRTHGIDGFYAQRNTRGAVVLTELVLQEIQSQLDNGVSVAHVAMDLEIKKNTIDKAIQSGRLHKPIKKISKQFKGSSFFRHHKK